MPLWTARIAICLISTAIPLSAAPPPRPYTVENYEVTIQPDLEKQRLSGEAGIRFHSVANTPISAIEFDAGGLEITSVAEGQSPQPFERDRGKLIVVLSNPLRGDEPRTITVRYQAGPAPGLKFFADQIYTSVTSDWMPCNDRPGERATLHLTITGTKTDTKVAASGHNDGHNITEWLLDSPTEPSWFGFALGSFTENTSDADGIKLRVLGAGKEISDPTTAAMHYFSERTGKRYPGQTYTQVVVHGDVTHAMAGLTLLPESYAQGLAKQPDNLRPLANELAHQWYGVAVGTKDSSDRWLSDGVSAFLADAFLGQRFGKAKYEEEIQHSRQVHKRLSGEAKDLPLSEATDGEIPEHKGAWFLYLVNQLVGDSAFWNGLRLYTSDQWGRAAASEDLQRAFDADRGTPSRRAKSGSTPLDNLFDMWVYGIPNTPTNRRRPT